MGYTLAVNVVLIDSSSLLGRRLFGAQGFCPFNPFDAFLPFFGGVEGMDPASVTDFPSNRRITMIS